MSTTVTEQEENKVIYKSAKSALAYFTPNNIGTVKRLNSVLYPVGYSDKFYTEVLASELEEYCQLILYNDIYVGAACCKFEDPSASSTRLYIATLGVLAPYRHQGLGSELLQNIISKAKASHTGGLPSPFSSIPVSTKSLTKEKKAAQAKSEKEGVKKVTGLYLHVHSSNVDALDWWCKRHFEKKELVDNYYSKLEPRSAWLLTMDITA